jgi:hypothetical protein
VPKNPPESMQHHLRQRLDAHAKEHWRRLTGIQVHFRSGFAYVAGELPGEDQPLPLCRLRFTGVLHTWGFALYLASSGMYEDTFLSTGLPCGSPEQALDCACGLYPDRPRTVTDSLAHADDRPVRGAGWDSSSSSGRRSPARLASFGH